MSRIEPTFKTPQVKRIILSNETIDWKDNPSTPGVKMAVIEGDPYKPGPYTMRVKFPAGFKVPPHRHSSDEKATILEGDLTIATGEKFDMEAPDAKTLMPGSFSLMPAGTPHFTWTKNGVVIQFYGMGPYDAHPC